MIEILPIGGYSEIGRNCVIVKYEDEAVMLDMGLHMENYIRLTQDDDLPFKIPLSTLIKENAIPDLSSVSNDFKAVKAVCISHAHLDHVGAVPFYASKIKCPVHGSKFTVAVLNALLKDKRSRPKFNVVEHDVNERFNVSKNIDVEFINITHSTPQTVMMVVHTPDGAVVYANDFKLDNAPLLGARPDYDKIGSIKNVKALIMDSLYALDKRKTPSESIAREMLRDVMLGVSTKGKNIVITTFSSHIARLKTILDLTKSLGRKPVFVGRSLAKYVDAAEEADIVDFVSQADFVRFGSKLESYFKKVKKTEDKVFIVTGHQGEPKAILSRLVKNNIFPFRPEDVVIFSCNIIPIEESFRNRENLENALKDKRVRIFSDLHVSGHAGREDHREFLNLIKPENLIPTHGEIAMLESQKQLAVECGIKKENVHILNNFNRVFLK